MNRQVMHRLVTLVLFCTGCLAGPAAAYDYMEMYPTTDLLGGDYQSEIPIADADPEECALMCLADTACKAATYMIPDGRYGPVAKCWLKNTVPAMSYDAQTTSWIKIDYTPPAAVAATTDTTGTLSVISTPAGATVSINGKAQGSTPLSGMTLAAGQYTVLLLMGGYSDAQKTITLAKGEEKTLEFILVKTTTPAPATGTIQVSSDPAGASVAVDGIPQGITPVTVRDVSPGGHTVTISRAGYADYTTTVTIAAGQTLPVPAVLVPVPATTTAVPGTGSIAVSSSPSAASVFLDGQDAGTTPCTLPQISSGSHTIVISMAGYRDFHANVDVAGGRESKVAAALLPDDGSEPSGSGAVDVRSDPSGATVFLDSEERGTSPLVLDGIKAGTHTIRLTHSGYPDFEDTVVVSNGNLTTVTAEFARAGKIPGFCAITGIISLVLCGYLAGRMRQAR